jgi:hypothetical protein
MVDHLRGHVLAGTAKGLSRQLTFSTPTEVTDLDIKLFIEEDVFWLESNITIWVPLGLDE